MSLSKEELKQAWIDFAHDALSSLPPPEEDASAEDIVDDMIAIASDFADGMLDELEERFGKTASAPRRRSGTRRRRPKDDDEPEEEESD